MHTQDSDGFNEDDETLLQQAVLAATDAGLDRMRRPLARTIAATARRLVAQREKALAQRALAEAGPIAKPNQALVVRVCELSQQLGRRRGESPIGRASRTSMSKCYARAARIFEDVNIRAISRLCVPRVTR